MLIIMGHFYFVRRIMESSYRKYGREADEVEEYASKFRSRIETNFVNILVCLLVLTLVKGASPN